MAAQRCGLLVVSLVCLSGVLGLAKAEEGGSARRGRLLGENLSKVTADQMTAVRATIRVIGPDVDPFNSAKQAALCEAVRTSMTTVEPDNVNILKVSSVTSDSSSQSATVSGSDDDSSTDSTSTSTDDGSDDSSTTPVSTTSTGVDNSRRRQLLEQPSQVVAAVLRRRLLDDYTLDSVTAYALANQADVLFELDSDNSTVTSDVIAELGLAVSNGTNSAIPAALQAQGYTEWGITLMSAYTSIPMPGNFTFPCSVKYGVFCLDGTGLTPAAVKGIIAACVIGFVLLLALLWFAVDMVHSPRKVVVVKPEDSAAAGTDKAVAIAAAGTAGGVAGVAGATAAKDVNTAPPPVNAHGGRFGFIDRWFQPPPSPFGSTVRVPILANSPQAAHVTPYTPLSAQGQGRTGFSAPGQGVPPTIANPAYVPPALQAETGSGPGNGAGAVSKAIPGLGSEATTPPPVNSLQRNSARYDGPAGIKPAGPRTK